MAKMLEQADIDRTFLSSNARDKIVNNYLEIVGSYCVYDIYNKKELILCLKEIINTNAKTKNQTEAIMQCKSILNKLINKSSN